MHACTEQITYWTRQVVVKYLYRIVVLVMVVVVCRQGNRVWGGVGGSTEGTTNQRAAAGPETEHKDEWVKLH